MVNALALLRRRREELPASARQAVDLLDADLSRFQRMVDDLLEISRTDQDGDRSTYDVVDLAELVEQAMRNLPAADRPAMENGGSSRTWSTTPSGTVTGWSRWRWCRRTGGRGSRSATGSASSNGSPAGTGRPRGDERRGLGLALVARHVGHHGAARGCRIGPVAARGS